VVKTDTLEPRISVILPGLLGYDSVLAALDAWEAQTSRARIEILVLCPDAEDVAPQLPAGQRAIRTSGPMLLNKARVSGIRQARAPYVFMAEDHCLPDPDCLAFILERIAEGWDAVGPALRPGSRRGLSDQGSFLIGYGEWMEPVIGGPVPVLPGHNVALKRDLLLARGDDLEDDLLVGAFLIRRLRQQGVEFVLDHRARMRHYDFPQVGRTLEMFVIVGAAFGVARTRGWPWPARLAYPLALPAVALGHGRRAWRQYRRAGRAAGLRRSCPLFTTVLAVLWAAGEAFGSIVGERRVAPFLWKSEVKPVSRAAAGEP
jgi:hypothetical protein